MLDAIQQQFLEFHIFGSLSVVREKVPALTLFSGRHCVREAVQLYCQIPRYEYRCIWLWDGLA